MLKSANVNTSDVIPKLSLISKLSPPDIYDAVYSFSTEEMNVLGLPPSALHKKGIFVRIMAFFYWFIREVYSGVFSKDKLDNSILANSTVFFYSSLNEKRALENIASVAENSVTISSQIGEPNKINFLIPYLLATIYAPFVIYKYFTSSGYQKKSYSYAFDQYLFSCGYIIYLRFILSKNRPLLTVISNDHSMLSRSFALVCLELKVPTAYIQHASVSDLFPKLIFDYAFLDGLDALDKYEKKGLGESVVFLSGIAKLDEAITTLKKQPMERNLISICPNTMDDLDAVLTVAKYIKEHTAQHFNVCLRPHPGDKRRFDMWREKASSIGAMYSDPTIECSSELILKSAFLVAADSNILLEAALLKTSPICMSFTGEILDHYGFIRRGVVFYAEDSSALVNAIMRLTNGDDFYRAAKYFSSTVETINEGASSNLIALTLNAIAQKRNVPDCWHQYAESVFESA